MRTVTHLLAILWLSTSALAAGPAFVVPTGQRQLFIDDVDIERIVNLDRTMHQPDKQGAVIRPDRALGIKTLQIRMNPIWSPEKKVWQIWDCASEPPDLHAGGYFFSAYYESKDGLHWTKPNVGGDIEYRGSTDNNFVSVIMGGKRHRAECIVRDNTDPDPNRRYKTLTPNVFNTGRGGYAVSPDGIHWTEISSPGINSADEWNLTFDEQEHLFLQYIKRGSKYGRAIWLATSKDFETWTDPELIFEADDLDQELGKQRIKAWLADSSYRKIYANDPKIYNVDVYHMCPFRYESVYLGMPSMYHATGKVRFPGNTDGFDIVELASSRNLKNWKRLGDRKAFIHPSKVSNGAWDLKQIMPPAGAVVRGEELWFYYSGIKIRGDHLVDGVKKFKSWAAICLATLRRDGFISLDAADTEGIVQTKLFTVPGGRLHVNADVADGELVVETLSSDGKVAWRSTPINGDRSREEVRFDEGDNTLNGKMVSLRFRLTNGKIYSYWFE